MGKPGPSREDDVCVVMNLTLQGPPPVTRRVVTRFAHGQARAPQEKPLEEVL
jgi:hypothetical protein